MSTQPNNLPKEYAVIREALNILHGSGYGQAECPAALAALDRLVAREGEMYDALSELTDAAIRSNLDPHYVRIAREALAKHRGNARVGEANV